VRRLGLLATFVLAACATPQPEPLFGASALAACATPQPDASTAASCEPAVPTATLALATTLEGAVAAVPVAEHAQAPARPVVPSAEQPAAQAPRPPQTEHGQWCVVAVSERRAADAKIWERRLTAAGFRVEIQPVKIGDTVWHRVLLPGYRASGEARAALPLVNQAAGVNDAFIWRRPQATATN
jgi:hypothetical protein